MEIPHDESEFLVHKRADEAGDKKWKTMDINVTAEVLCVDEFSARSCCSMITRSRITEKNIYISCLFLKYQSFEFADSA